MRLINKLFKKIKNIIIIFKIRLKNRGISRQVKFKEPSNIHIGANCRIGENSYLLCWNNYSFNSVNQNLNSTITIGNNFSATRNLTIQCCNNIYIGNDVLVASNVFICDYNHGMENTKGSYLDNPLTLSEVYIDDGVWIGQGAYILPGVRIGKNAVVGAGSVVTKDIPELCVVAGNPARVIRKIKYNKKNEGDYNMEENNRK